MMYVQSKLIKIVKFRTGLQIRLTATVVIVAIEVLRRSVTEEVTKRCLGIKGNDCMN